MHVVVVGCGRVGRSLAHHLVEAGHSVCVIDRNASALQHLGESFAGRTLVGVGFDRDVLTEAGTDSSCAVAAVTSGDNSNILIARVAREVFGVERVVARIYDPKRATVYERLGIPTVASVAWTSQRVLRRLFPSQAASDWNDPSGRFSIIERTVSAAMAGTTIATIEARASGRVALISRNGSASIPAIDLLVQQGDLVHLVVAAEQADALGDMFGDTTEASK